MWIWIIKTGELVRDGKVIGVGYSGGNKGKNPEGKNNPAMQHVHDIGPLPCGEYEVHGPPFDDPRLGKYVMRLIPRPGTNTFGRSGFCFHGDNKTNPGCASEGCPIQSRAVREQVWESGDRCFYVLAEKPSTYVLEQGLPREKDEEENIHG
jgi:hypothetical protein